MVLLLIILEIAFLDSKTRAPLEVSFLNVGQGDAILINYEQHWQILIDGGPNPVNLLTELDKTLPPFDKKIELILITHPDRDHFLGLLGVLKKYKIGQIISNGGESDDEPWRALRKLAKEQGIPWSIAGLDSEIDVGSNFKLALLNPDSLDVVRNKDNDYSLAARLDYGKHSFLFTGDIGFKGEANLWRNRQKLNADYLKVAHHGSPKSTAEWFLTKVNPRLAIISVGENDYGHPSKEVLARLAKHNIEIKRTDQAGTIIVRCWLENDQCRVSNLTH